MQAGVYVLRPMVSYQALNFDADAVLVGLVGSAFAVAPLIIAIPVGRVIDRGLAGRAIFLGSALSVIAGLGLVFAQNIWWLVVSMPILGIGHLLGMVGGQTMISNHSPGSSLEKNFGLLTFYASIGHAVGPFFGGLLAQENGAAIDVSLALWLGIALLFLATIVTAGLIPRELAKTKKVSSKADLKTVLATKGYKPAIFVAGMVTAVVDVLLVFLPVIGLALGFSTNEIGVLLALRAIGSMLTRLVLGQLTKAFGFRILLIGSILLAMIGSVILGLVSSFWVFGFVVFAVGISLAVGQPLTMAWVSRIAPSESRGLAISMRLTANRLGQVVIPAIAGVIALTSTGAVFFLLAGILGFASLASWTALRANEK